MFWMKAKEIYFHIHDVWEANTCICVKRLKASTKQHTHASLTALCRGLPGVNRYQKGKTNLDSQFFTGRMPFLPPNQQRQNTEGKTTSTKQTADKQTRTLIRRWSSHNACSKRCVLGLGLSINGVHQLIPYVVEILHVLHCTHTRNNV